jgi:hypothetical protein
MLMNLTIGLPITLLCLALQAIVTFWSVRYYLQQPDPSGHGLFAHIRPLLVVMIVMMLGNFVQIVIWGVLFILLGEFTAFYEAIYHSAVNFTSLGYGDIVMSKRWKLMGPPGGCEWGPDVRDDQRGADGDPAAVDQGGAGKQACGLECGRVAALPGCDPASIAAQLDLVSGRRIVGDSILSVSEAP